MKNKIILGVSVFALSVLSFQINNATLLDGEALYKEATCIACHGADGKAAVLNASDLTNPELTLEQRIKTITNGSEKDPTMVAYKDVLTKEEIQAIAEYTMTFVKK